MISPLPSQIRDALLRDGFLILEGVVGRAELDVISRSLDIAAGEPAVRRRGETFAIRNLHELVPQIRAVAFSDPLISMVRPFLGDQCFPVRSILFDKPPQANWAVPWHQDLTIAVRERIELDGFGPWTQKAGVPHVQPPAAVMERVLALRLHLDDSGTDNAPLRVVPGSHRYGRLGVDQFEQLRAAHGEVICSVSRGGVILMCPLLLHASSPAFAPSHRRVIHIEYAAEPLPLPLQWRMDDSN